MGFIWSHSASWFNLTEYFPAFCAKRALKVSAGVSLWRHFRWQMIIRYFFSTGIIFFSFPSSQAELWSATLSDSASHLPALKTPQLSHLLTYFKKKFYCLWKKILFCCPCFQLSAAKLLLSPVAFVSKQALQRTHRTHPWSTGLVGCSWYSLKWPGKSFRTIPFS